MAGRKPTEDASDKRKLAFTLRLAGLSWAEIASHEFNGGRLYEHGSSAANAAKQYEDELDFNDDLHTHRAIDLARFDSLQRAMWRKAIGGDLAAAKFVLMLIKAREDLLGVKGYQPKDSVRDPLDELSRRREGKEEPA